jgi:hypothetical protein
MLLKTASKNCVEDGDSDIAEGGDSDDATSEQNVPGGNSEYRFELKMLKMTLKTWILTRRILVGEDSEGARSTASDNSPGYADAEVVDSDEIDSSVPLKFW